MAPAFSEENLLRLEQEYATISCRAQTLVEAIILKPYRTETGKEYAHHGVARRIGILARCIHQVFKLLPPNFEGIPDGDVRENVTVYLQAFVFNAFGALDNLAFLWVSERDVRGANGRQLPNGRVGLSRPRLGSSGLG